MKIDAFVAAWLGAVLIAPVASADFAGLYTDWKGTTFTAGPGFVALNIYACFDSATDRCLSVTGASVTPLGGSVFYQDPFGSATEPNPILFPFFPDLQWDTFVTIGLTQQGPPGTPLTALEPGSSMTSTGFTGGWFTDGDAPQGLGQPIIGQPGFYVLLMQLSFQNPGILESAGGVMTVAWKTATSGAQFSRAAFESHIHLVPAPGALALLGIAGLTCFRRRR